MWQIPKNTKLTPKIWKNFSIIDTIAIFILFLFAYAILRSNLSGKFYILLPYTALCVLLFLDADGDKIYTNIGQYIKYLGSSKKFSNSNVNKLIPYTSFLDDGTINYGEYYGKVLSIGSVNYDLLDGVRQELSITLFGRLMNELSMTQFMQIVKLDQPIIFDDCAENLFKKIQFEQSKAIPNEAKLKILKCRLGQIDKLNNLEKQYHPYYYIALFDESKKNLEALCSRAEQIMGALKLEPYVLDTKEVVLFLKYCYSRNFDERDIEDIDPKNYMDFIKPKKINFGFVNHKIDDVDVCAYAIADYPVSVPNGWATELFSIDNTKVVINVRPVEHLKARKRIDTAAANVAEQSARKVSEMVEQETHLETMGRLMQSLKNGNESLFDCSVVIIGYNNEKEDFGAFQKQIKNRISGAGFRVSSLISRQLDAFISSNISRRTQLKRFERGINTMSLAACFPFSCTSIIDTDGILLGANQYPVILDTNKRGGAFKSSNIMVFGTTGGGKSYAVKTFLANRFADNTMTFVLDPENEYTSLCKNIGGSYIDVGNSSKGRLNPFHIYMALQDTDLNAEISHEQHCYDSYHEHLGYLENFFQITLPGLNSDTLEALNNMVVKMYERAGILPTTDFMALSPEDFPIFDDLHSVLQQELEQEGTASARANLQRAISYIQKFTGSGRYANLWNGASVLSADNDFTVFNFQTLFATKSAALAGGQLLTVMRFLEQRVIEVHKHNIANPNNIIRTIIALDEAYLFIDKKYPEALDFAFRWSKRIRKYMGSLIFITQNLGDMIGNAEIAHKTTAIINNAQYSLIFNLAASDLNMLIDLYKNAGEINETEQNYISTNEVGNCFLIASPTHRMNFEIIAAEEVAELFN